MTVIAVMISQIMIVTVIMIQKYDMISIMMLLIMCFILDFLRIEVI